jgi:DNA polymerase (family X)
MTETSFSEALLDLAFLAELKGENPFKIRALQHAAETFAERDEPLAELVESGEIGRLPGVGKGTQTLAQEFAKTGRLTELEDLKREFPAGLFEIRMVHGLGPKKIKALFDNLQVSSLAELEYACQENRLLDLKGFGAKTQANILQGIARLKGYKGKVILPRALDEAELVREQLEALPGAELAVASGELRRLTEVVSSLDFVLEGSRKQLEPALKEAGYEGSQPFTSVSPAGLRVRVWLAGKNDFGRVLLETTGPAEFVESFGKLTDAAAEADLFAKKHQPFVEPECRELGLHPKHLIEEKEIRGVFHVHTDWSDGKNTLAEMVAAAEALGYEYLGISDHSQSAFYAHGLDEKRVLQQRKEIDRLQEQHPGIRLFHGIESDILAEGELDYPESFLKHFDFVIASVHGQMKMPAEQMTKRLCAALENPHTTWLGHWTGRMLLGRDSYAFDVEAVLKCAAREGKSIELNANPYRLDIDWRLLPRAAELGVSIGIHPDAHSAGGLADTRFGVWAARKGGLTAKQVTNTQSRKEMEAWLAERKPH